MGSIPYLKSSAFQERKFIGIALECFLSKVALFGSFFFSRFKSKGWSRSLKGLGLPVDVNTYIAERYMVIRNCRISLVVSDSYLGSILIRTLS